MAGGGRGLHFDWLCASLGLLPIIKYKHAHFSCVLQRYCRPFATSVCLLYLLMTDADVSTVRPPPLSC